MEPIINFFKPILVQITSNCQDIEAILVCSSLVLAVVKYLFDYYYSFKCERFYGISKEYFSKDIIYIIMDGLLICMFGALNYFLFITSNNIIAIIFIVTMTLAILLVIFIFNNSKYSIVIRKKEYTQKLLLVALIFSIIIALTKNYCINLYRVFLLLYILVFVFAALRIAFVKLESKNEYEMVKIKDGRDISEYIVLSHYKSKLLCVKFDFKELGKGSKNTLNLITKSYFLIDYPKEELYTKDFAKDRGFVLKVNDI